MPKRTRTLSVPHFGNGIDLSADASRISTKGNTLSMNMLTDSNGAISTGLHATQITDIDWGEGTNKPQGSIQSYLYPNIWIVVINGKIKYVDLDTKIVKEFDTTVTLNTSARVKMIQWRGQIYFCNGVNVMGRLSIGKLASAINGSSTQLDVETEEGYRFNDPSAVVNSGRTTVFVNEDEITYSAVSGGGSGDSLTGASGIATTHAAGSYVTQYNPVTPYSFIAQDIAVFKDTMFAIPATENGTVRIGKTISVIGDIITGNLHDFSDNERIIVGEGGPLNALHATETRLYIASDNHIDYITTQISPVSGALEFTTVFNFTRNYGILNPFCVTQHEDMIVVLTGGRLIRIGYAPQNDQILPDQNFDKPILPLLQQSLQTGELESVFYDSGSKILFTTINLDGSSSTILRSEQTTAYTWPCTLDIVLHASYNNNLYFINSIGETYVIDGTLIAEGGSENHQFISAKLDDRNREDKLFLKGTFEGKIEELTTILMEIYVDGILVGGTRTLSVANGKLRVIKESTADYSAIGSGIVGSVVIGGSLQTDNNILTYEHSFLVGKRGKDIQIKLSSNKSGDYWSIANFQVEYVPSRIQNTLYH